MTAESQRIQTLRGLACVLLVAFHVIGSHPTSGLHVDNESLYRQFANLFAHVRMPLFTFLSGFVYAYRPVLSGQLETFAKKKLMRLLLPFLFVSTLYFFVASAAPDASGAMPLQDIWKIYVFPYVHFWFLQALILIFIGVAILESFGALATFGRFALVLAVIVAIHLGVDMENDENAPFSIVQAAYLAPFFLLGLGANRFRALFEQPAVLWTCFAIFVVTMGVHTWSLWFHYPMAGRGTVLGFIIGATATLAMVRLFPRMRWLEMLGAYSFAIYLFHPFFVGGTRTALKMTGLFSTELMLVAGIAIGVIGPAIMERVLGNVPGVSRLLFGQGPAHRKTSTATAPTPSAPLVAPPVATAADPVTRPHTP
jgi:surface polysaccharide O-acyltransferase-like enzyme